MLIDVIRSKNEDTFVRLVEALSHEYLSMYPTFKGREALAAGDKSGVATNLSTSPKRS